MEPNDLSLINLSNTFNFLQHLTVFWLFPTISFYYFKICASPIPQKITQFTGFTKSCFSNSARWALNSALESFHVPLRNCYISFPFFQIPSTLPPSFSADYNSTPYFMGGRGGRREVKKRTKDMCVLSTIFLSSKGVICIYPFPPSCFHSPPRKT